MLTNHIEQSVTICPNVYGVPYFGCGNGSCLWNNIGIVLGQKENKLSVFQMHIVSIFYFCVTFSALE